jgi:hypothetical protein
LVCGELARIPSNLETQLRRPCSDKRYSANAPHISPMTAAMPIHGSKYLIRLRLFREEGWISWENVASIRFRASHPALAFSA